MGTFGPARPNKKSFATFVNRYVNKFLKGIPAGCGLVDVDGGLIRATSFFFHWIRLRGPEKYKI